MDNLAVSTRLAAVKRWAWVLAFLIGVPVVGVGTAAVLETVANRRLQSALARGSLMPAVVRMTVADLCAIERASGGAGSADCVKLDRRRWLRNGSLAVGAAGVGWVGLILLAGHAARRDRRLLLRAFRPGFYLTGLLVATLVIAHAALVTGVVVLIFGRLVGAGQALGVLVLGALVGAYSIVRVTFGAVRNGSDSYAGRVVTREEAPELWRRVDTIAAALGAQPPDQIIITLIPSFFVTELDIDVPAGRLTGRTLCCSLSLARILTVQELETIIGHEMAHFSGEDTRYSTHFAPIYRGTIDALAAVHAQAQGLAALAMLPAIALLELFVESFELARRRLGRERELAADAAGARVAGVRASASALVKVHAFDGIWQAVVDRSIAELQRGDMFVNMTQMYADTVEAHSVPETFGTITEQATSHPTDTHPPLAERLQALGVTLESVQAEALVTVPDVPASTLVQHHDALERELSEQFQLLLADELDFSTADPSAGEERPGDPGPGTPEASDQRADERQRSVAEASTATR